MGESRMKKELIYSKIHTKIKRERLESEFKKITKEIHQKFDKKPKIKKCPCCLSRNIKYYCKKFGYELDTCENCSHIFTNPFPKDAALNFFYNSEYKDFENKFFMDSFEERLPIFEQRLELLDTYQFGKKILDVGTAVGIFIEANYLRKDQYKITACDLSEKACAYMKQRFPNLEIINNNITKLPKRNFDCVTLWDTVEHIPEPSKLLHAVRDQIRDGGYFVFSTPNTDSFEWNIMKEGHVQLLPPGHVNLYNKNNIEILLNRCGLQVVDIFTLNPSLDLTYIHHRLKEESDSISRRAWDMLYSLSKSEEIYDSFQNLMRNKRMAGNMIVIAKKND